MRLRLGLLQDQAAIDRQIAREAAEAQAKKAKAEIPTVKTEAQTKADEAAALREKEKGAEKAKSTSTPKVRIRPLTEAKAIDSGATFISETFLFGVALSTIVFESWRQRRKEATRRGDVADKLHELEEKDRAKAALLEELQHEVEDLRSARVHSGSSWFWGSKNPRQEPADTAPGSLTKRIFTSPSNTNTHAERVGTVPQSESGAPPPRNDEQHAYAKADAVPKSVPSATADEAAVTASGEKLAPCVPSHTSKSS